MIDRSSPDALAYRRKQLVARLAAERAYFLRQYERLAAETLCGVPVNGEGWTAKDLLGHVGYWDAFHARRMSLVLDGRKQEIELLGGQEERDALNQQAFEQFRGMQLDEVLAVCLKERRGFLTILDSVPDELLHRRIRVAGEWQTMMRTWVRRRFLHDAGHAVELERWRSTLSENGSQVQVGPKVILQAIIRAAWQEWATAVALVPADDWAMRPISGEATLLELMRRLTGWAKFGAGTLARLAQGPLAFPVTTATYELFDDALAAANQGQTEDQVWVACLEAQQKLLSQIETTPEPALAIAFVTPWGTATTGYRFATFCGTRPSVFAADLRRSLALPNLPRRLRQNPLSVT
jgi:hypothetical protein